MDAAELAAWQTADQIFDQLLDLPDAERTARLVALTPQLRRRVEQLLAAHTTGDGLLESPLPTVRIALAHDALVGRRLGRWRLLEEIGRGGMSVVYGAVADEGATGQVAAVKVLTLGALAGQGRERFLQEQQALLRLRHPCIASLYDAGVAADGTPWLAMARVEGDRIDTWCDARELDTAARVRLLLLVCEAVASAHRSLVIHRDIKPGNVLVGDDGHVHLLDFGIARLVDDVDHQHTVTALRALTPEYAAPEQFVGAPAATTMDVYGIGALLYRVLAGTGSRAPGADRGGGPELPPSRALQRNAAVPEVERQQRARALRGDLDVIVMKALATAPEARYASVEALADDLRRWLDARPVRAQPPSWRYQATKFIARNRWAMAACATLVLVLLAGIGGILWQAGIARTEAARATLAAEQSQAQLGYLNSVLEVLAPATEDVRELDRREIIAAAANRAQTELARQPALLASVELNLGKVAERIGNYDQAAKLYLAALQARRRLFGSDSGEVGELLAALGAVSHQLTPPDPKRTEALLTEAVILLRRHRPASPELTGVLTELAGRLAEQDRYEEASAHLTEAEALCRQPALQLEHCDEVWLMRGEVEMREKHYAASIAPLQHALALRRRRHGEAHADTIHAYALLGHAYERNGDLQRGIAMLERAHSLQQRIYPIANGVTLQTLLYLAQANANADQNARALTLLQAYLAQAQVVFGPRDGRVALGLGHLGTLYFNEGRYAEARNAHRRAHDLYLALYGPRGTSTVISLGNYTKALAELGHRDEALRLTRQSLATYRELFGASSNTASALGRLAQLRREAGEHREALKHYDEALAMYAGQDNNASSQCAMRSNRSLVLQDMGKATRAESEARAALAEIETRLGRGHRCHSQGLAVLAEVACKHGAKDCSALREQIATVLQQPNVPGRTRMLLERAIAKAVASR